MSSDKPSNVSTKTMDPKSKATNFSCAKLFHCSWTGFLLAGVIVAVGSWAWAQTLVFDENEAGERLSEMPEAVWIPERSRYELNGCFRKNDGVPWKCEELFEGALDDVVLNALRQHIIEKSPSECTDFRLSCVTLKSEDKYGPILDCVKHWQGYYYFEESYLSFPSYKSWTLKKKKKMLNVYTAESTILYEESISWWKPEVTQHMLLKNTDNEKLGSMVWKLSNGEYFGCWNRYAAGTPSVTKNRYPNFATHLIEAK